MMRSAVMMLAAAATAPAAPEVRQLDLPGISSAMWESHPAIDPLTGDLWFVRSDAGFSGWRLYMSRCVRNRWTAATPAPIAAPGLEADPWFTRDGRALWFISSRATGGAASKGLDIWRVSRARDGGWEAPEKLPAPVNSDDAEWFPRVAPDGWLYFGSRRPGGLGKDDIWRARQAADGRWTVENAGPAINTADAEYEFAPAPNGKWGVLATDKGLFRIEHTPAGWRRAGRFGPTVNANGTEIGPLIARDGRSFVFSRDAGAGKSGELFVARLGASRAGPARCDWPPQRGSSWRR
ncbi:TolB family protein [Sphingomonas lycopersici]|uniref:PD40 domain-containing protein n=1 Tax=Sphingomonas lycopersici TaxID=2951807 RepID=A0AA41Z880_9SPHN|nr:hypothetical protein [Sphingomonas lycopersici]MCW6535792.1 hypothetical protein [Sphingomonas lycopersici]